VLQVDDIVAGDLGALCGIVVLAVGVGALAGPAARQAGIAAGLSLWARWSVVCSESLSHATLGSYRATATAGRQGVGDAVRGGGLVGGGAGSGLGLALVLDLGVHGGRHGRGVALEVASGLGGGEIDGGYSWSAHVHARAGAGGSRQPFGRRAQGTGWRAPLSWHSQAASSERGQRLGGGRLAMRSFDGATGDWGCTAGTVPGPGEAASNRKLQKITANDTPSRQPAARAGNGRRLTKPVTGARRARALGGSGR
jgi:hypothetical protein